MNSIVVCTEITRLWFLDNIYPRNDIAKRKVLKILFYVIMLQCKDCLVISSVAGSNVVSMHSHEAIYADVWRIGITLLIGGFYCFHYSRHMDKSFNFILYHLNVPNSKLVSSSWERLKYSNSVHSKLFTINRPL